jgi:hypothetical protein
MLFTTSELGEILKSVGAMQQRGQAFEDPKVGYWMARLIAKIETVEREVHKESHEICERLCLRGPDGKPIFSGNQYQFRDDKTPMELTALNERQHEIEVKFFPVSLDCFKIQNSGLDPIQLKAFNKLIIEPS